MTYTLDDFAVSNLSRAAEACRDLRHHGLRESYGLAPNRPLSAAETRDCLAIERAIGRLFAADQARRTLNVH